MQPDVCNTNAGSLPTLRTDLNAVYASYEGALRDWIAAYPRGVSCAKGCCACCDMSIGVYLPEAVTIAQTLTDAQYAAVADHANRVRAYAETTEAYDDYQAGYRVSEIGWCPLLDVERGICSIYDRRPANCRHVFSNMPAKYCAKGAEFLLAHNADEQAAYARQLDPDVNADGLPFLAPLHDIFHELYELYLMMISARYFNVIVLADMSWLIVLVREYNLAGLASQPDGTRDDFVQQVQRLSVYHPHLLTDCQEIPPYMKAASAEVDFAYLP